MERVKAIRKLVDTFHLNTDERKLFDDIPLTKTEVISGIAEILSEQNSYPSSWSSDEDYDGVCLEINEGLIKGTYKTEVSLAAYSLVETRTFAEPFEAAKYAMEKMFNEDIDGIDLK